MTELRMPGGTATADVPDDLVDKYRAVGWSPAVPEEPAKPAAKKRSTAKA